MVGDNQAVAALEVEPKLGDDRLYMPLTAIPGIVDVSQDPWPPYQVSVAPRKGPSKSSESNPLPALK